jgi:hypothetical protein
MHDFKRNEYQLLQPFAEALFNIPGISDCGKDHLPQDVLMAGLTLIGKTVPDLIKIGYDQGEAYDKLWRFFCLAAGQDMTVAQRKREEARAIREAQEEARLEVYYEAIHNL